MQDLRAPQLKAPGVDLSARFALWFWLAVSIALAASALALLMRPLMGATAGALFGAVCALALSQALLILAFIKGAFAWVTVINTGTSAVVGPRAPDMDRRVHRPPRAIPALSARLALSSPLRPQLLHLPRRPIPDGRYPGAATPRRPLSPEAAAPAWTSAVAQVASAPREREPVIKSQLELVGDLSSGISHIRACAAVRGAPR